jgi:carbon monoxide dehydrogenase subunit G
MIDIKQHVEINRQASAVFAFVSDQTNAPRWQRGLEEVHRLTDGPIGVGTRYRFVRTLMGRRMSGENEYTRYDLDRSTAFTATSGGWPLQASYLVEPVGEGRTRLTSSLELHPAGPFRLLERLLATTLRRDVKRNLASLKDLLENAQAPVL